MLVFVGMGVYVKVGVGVLVCVGTGVYVYVGVGVRLLVGVGVGVLVFVACVVAVGVADGHTDWLVVRETSSTHQPVPATEESVPSRKRNVKLLWPANVTRFTVTCVQPLLVPVQAERPASGLP